MQAARRNAIPTLVMFSVTAPGKSRLEMEAFTGARNARTSLLKRGKLSFYEEFPEGAAAAILDFLSAGPSIDRPSDPLPDHLPLPDDA